MRKSLVQEACHSGALCSPFARLIEIFNGRNLFWADDQQTRYATQKCEKKSTKYTSANCPKSCSEVVNG